MKSGGWGVKIFECWVWRHCGATPLGCEDFHSQCPWQPESCAWWEEGRPSHSFLSLTLPILQLSPADWQPWREGREARRVRHCSLSTRPRRCLFFSSNRFLFEMMTSLGRHLVFEVSLPPCWTGCSFLTALFFQSVQSLTSRVQEAQKSCLQP